MVNPKKIFLALVALLMSGCVLSQVPAATPTVEVSATASPSATMLPTFTPSLTVTPAPQVVNVPTDTLGPPTDTPTITPTPNPNATYAIQQGDTLLYIIQQPPFFYRNLSDNLVTEILNLNPTMRDINHVPGAGSSITLPLPTATTTPPGFDLTASAQPNAPQVNLPGNAQIIQVQIKDGDTIVGIAQSNSTTLPIVATLNPQLSFFNCDFTNPSGGPDCNVSLRVGDMVNVPALTPTPTLSPTISGSETPTPTPTYAAPVLIFPPDQGSAPARTFQLEWISAGVLKDKEVYLVEIQDETAGTQHVDISSSTSYDLPDALVPTDGKPHTIHWRVSVAAPNDQGAYRYIGAQGQWRTFTWQSR